MITHYDGLYGLPGAELLSRSPTAGGTITRNPGSTVGAITFTTHGGVQCVNNVQGTYQYSTPLHTPDFHVLWTIDYDPSDNGTNLGFVISNSTAFASYVEISWNQVTQILKLDNNGTASTFTTTFATTATHTFELIVKTLSNGVEDWQLFIDGVNVLGTSNPGIPTPTYLFLRMHGPTAGGTTSTLTQIVAKDLASFPTRPTSFQSPQLGVFAQFTPATLSALAALKYEYPARAIILKGPFAENAVTWLMENTPPENITAP